MKNKYEKREESEERQEHCQTLSKQERLDNIQSRRGDSKRELKRVQKMK